MQSLNSIERFLFSGDIHLLLEKNQDENSRNNVINRLNPSIQNQFNMNQTKLNNEKEYISVPLKLLGSILNLYFYSNNPKKAYDIIQANSNTNRDMGIGRRTTKNLSRVSSIQSGSSMYISESNFYGENDISGDTQGIGLKVSRPRYLEDCILIKLNHSDIYLIDYNLENASIEYKHRETEKKYKFRFKHCTLKEKNYIKIMIIIESYKYSIKNSLLLNNIDPMRKRNMSIRNKTIISRKKNTSNRNNYEMTKTMSSDIMNTEFIIHFLDNLIMNKFKILIIYDFFFQEEQNLLKIFTNFLVDFKEMKLTINLFEEEESSFAEDNMAGGESNKETYASAFNDRFNLDSYENKQGPNNNVNDIFK